jgi:Transposase DDE domain
LRAQDRDDGRGPQDPGNPAVNFRGERRSNATHRSVTDPDCRYVSKGESGTGAYPGYSVTAVMENRHRLLLGLEPEVYRSAVPETSACVTVLDKARACWGFIPTTLGADKGFFAEAFIETLLQRQIEPHIAVKPRGAQAAHARVWMRVRGLGYQLSQRARKKIEELFGEAKDWHGLRRFRRRGVHRVRQESYLIGWVLNRKRLARALSPQAQPV